MTRFRYGDEQHLDEALGRIFMFGRVQGIARRYSSSIIKQSPHHSPSNPFTTLPLGSLFPRDRRSCYDLHISSNRLASASAAIKAHSEVSEGLTREMAVHLWKRFMPEAMQSLIHAGSRHS